MGYLRAGRARDGAGVSHVESSRDKAVPDNFAMTKLGSAQQDILITALPTKRKMKSDKMCWIKDFDSREVDPLQHVKLVMFSLGHYLLKICCILCFRLFLYKFSGTVRFTAMSFELTS